MKNYSYEGISDSLIVSSRVKGDVVKENVMLGDFILTLTDSGEICSVEIIGASNYLKEI